MSEDKATPKKKAGRPPKRVVTNPAPPEVPETIEESIVENSPVADTAETTEDWTPVEVAPTLGTTKLSNKPHVGKLTSEPKVGQSLRWTGGLYGTITKVIECVDTDRNAWHVQAHDKECAVVASHVEGQEYWVQASSVRPVFPILFDERFIRTKSENHVRWDSV